MKRSPPLPPWPRKPGSACCGCWSRPGPNGLPAGDIAERVGVPPSTLSFHLKELDRAGLARSWRVQRQIRYAADYEGLRRLLAFLTADCCNGHPEICGGLIEAVAACGCPE